MLVEVVDMYRGMHAKFVVRPIKGNRALRNLPNRICRRNLTQLVLSAHAVKDQLGISLEEGAPNGMVVEISRENTTGVLPRPAVRWFKEALDKGES